MCQLEVDGWYSLLGMKISGGAHARVIKGITTYPSGKVRVHMYDPAMGKYTTSLKGLYRSATHGHFNIRR